jgi:triacylglycerol lipase
MSLSRGTSGDLPPAPGPPLVLHHGLLGFLQLQVGPVRLSYFHNIDRAIASHGYDVILSRVHPTASIARRAAQLKQTILARLKGMNRQERVILLAHSMGGLDARYMITHLGMARHVQTLLTVTTPHHGSAWADWCVQNLGRRLRALPAARYLGLDVEGVIDLTRERCARFNERTPDVPEVRYYSVSCARPWQRITPLLLPSWRVIYAAEGDNDGLVSVASATWGEHLGTWPADHLHSINKRFVLEHGQKTGDITPYYLRALQAVMREDDPGGPGDGK